MVRLRGDLYFGDSAPFKVTENNLRVIQHRWLTGKGIFKVDADSFIISSVALSLSVPFVPVVAAALKNKTIVISGVIIGIIGYAIGNYMGAIVAYLLKYFY